MTDRIAKLIPLLILAGAGLGVIIGLYLPGVGHALGFLGALFLGALKILIVPLIVAELIVGLKAFGDTGKAIRTGVHALSYFGVTALVAVVVGLAVALLMGASVNPSLSPMSHGLGWHSISDSLGSLIPGNLVEAVSDGKYLGVVLLAMVLGGVLTAMRMKARTVVSFFSVIHEGLMKVVDLLMLAAPIGVFSLVGKAVADNNHVWTNWSVVGGNYLPAVLIGLAIHALVILPIAFWIFSRRSPVEFYSQLSPAIFAAFGTASAINTFPITSGCLNQRAKLDQRAESLVLPLGSIINLDGTVIVLVIAALAAAAAFGVPIGIGQLILVAVLAIVLSIGAAGIPSATLVTAPVMFAAVGLSLDQALAAGATLLLVDWLVDRLRAVVNLCGTGVGAAVVAESFELKTARRPASRERRPATGRTRTPATRERRPARSDDRGRGRQNSRQESTSQRGRRTASAPRERTNTRTKTNRKEPSPFEMKASSRPSLEGQPERSAPVRTGPETTKPEPRRREPRPRRTDSNGPARGARENSAPEKPTRPQTRETRPERESRRPRERAAAPTPPPAETPEAQAPNESNGRSEDFGRLNPSTVARELARVSAQLRENGQDIGETPEAPTTPVKPARQERPRSTRARSPRPEPMTEEPAIDNNPRPEQESDKYEIGRPTERVEEPNEAITSAEVEPEPEEVAPATESRPEAEPVAESKPEPEPEPDAAPEPSFGRSRRFKGAAVKQAAKEKSDEKSESVRPEPPVKPTAPEPQQESSVEPAEKPAEEPEAPVFGRVKRKRTRR